MPTKTADRQPPGGLMRLFLRAPIWLYRARLGWLLGNRFLMMRHVGRKSGLPRYVVVEVAQRDPASGTYYIVSGWGEKADWLRNIEKTPQVMVWSGGRKFAALAGRLSPAEAELVMLDYGRRHPAALHNLARIMGYQIGATEEAYRVLGRMVPTVALRPLPQGTRA